MAQIQEKAYIPNDEKSYFSGSFWGLLGYNLLVGFVSLITFGIAFPWMCCAKQRWVAKNTVICGKRMYFDGTGAQLIGNYLLWSFLTIITFGIYGFWLSLSIKKWITKHTHFEGEKDNNSYFDGTIGGYIGYNLLKGLIILVTFSLGAALADKMILEWEYSHTVIDSRRLSYTGSAGNLFVKYILWGFLSAITLSIFAWFIPIKFIKYKIERVIDNEHTTKALIDRSEYRTNIHTDAASFKTYLVEKEMECVKAGVIASISQEELFELAQSGIRCAQYEYAVSYSGGKYEASPYYDFLKASAQSGYAPAMSLYALSNFCETSEETLNMLKASAKLGEKASITYLMRLLASEGLSRGEKNSALPLLSESIRWHDLLKESEEKISELDEENNTKCVLLERRIRAKRKAKKKSKAPLVILIVFLSIIVIGVLGSIFGMLLNKNKNNDISANRPGSSYSDSVGSISDSSEKINFFQKIFLLFADKENGKNNGVIGDYDGVMAGNIAGIGDNFYYDDETSEGDDVTVDVGGNDDYDNDQGYGDVVLDVPGGLIDRVLTTLKGDFYTVESYQVSENTMSYHLNCSHWFWESDFTMGVEFSGDEPTYISVTGPRYLEANDADPTICAVELQYIARVFYTEIGLGDGFSIDIPTDAGDYDYYYSGWSFIYRHTEDTLSLYIIKQ